MEFYRNHGKRWMDVAMAALALALALPLLAAVACAVCVVLGRPILFRQRRPGLYGRSFELLKFRTMLDAHDQFGAELPDERRLTRFGRFLRATSLDELPELWNVLRGDMSLVGPRPLLDSYLALYSPRQARRHDVKPGITGWAQIHGRNDATWESRFECDLYYVEHVSLWLDLRILFKTIWLVMSRSGVHAKGHATMPKFTGAPVRPALETKHAA